MQWSAVSGESRVDSPAPGDSSVTHRKVKVLITAGISQRWCHYCLYFWWVGVSTYEYLYQKLTLLDIIDLKKENLYSYVYLEVMLSEIKIYWNRKVLFQQIVQPSSRSWLTVQVYKLKWYLCKIKKLDVSFQVLSD